MSEINLKLSVEEANVLLESLGQMPFSKVYTLINKIQQQASQQVNGGNGAAPAGADTQEKVAEVEAASTTKRK